MKKEGKFVVTLRDGESGIFEEENWSIHRGNDIVDIGLHFEGGSKNLFRMRRRLSHIRRGDKLCITHSYRKTYIFFLGKIIQRAGNHFLIEGEIEGIDWPDDKDFSLKLRTFAIKAKS